MPERKIASLIPEELSMSRARWLRDFGDYLTGELRMGHQLAAMMWAEAMHDVPDFEYGV